MAQKPKKAETAKEPEATPSQEPAPKRSAKNVVPEPRITHYTGSVAVFINKAYPEGQISEELRAAVKAVLEKYK